jgi:serine/threonine protein phosphatase 1
MIHAFTYYHPSQGWCASGTVAGRGTREVIVLGIDGKGIAAVMSGRLIAIGDIHGCAAALDALLAQIVPQADDTIVALGDFVDRGENSAQVIDRLIELKSKCHLVALRGNHEEMMLDVVIQGLAPQPWLQFGGVATLDSYHFTGDLSVIPQSHRDFLQSLRDYYETDDYFFVHAAYHPARPLDQQPAQLLRWHSLKAGIPDRHHSGKIAVVGHTADRGGEIFDVGHLLCIDTYCYGGGFLTAIELPSRKLWQADQLGNPRAA